MRVKSDDSQKLFLLLAIPIAIEFGLAWTLYLLFRTA
jgi:hypothetical protein